MGAKKSKEEEPPAPEPETVSQKSFRLYIVCLNWCILLGSISMFVVSIAVAVNLPISEGPGDFVKFGPMVLSAALFGFSVAALRGGLSGPTGRICYFVFIIVASLIIIISGIICLMFLYYAEESATTSSLKIPTGAGHEMMIAFNDYSMAVYNECCTEEYNLTAVEDCQKDSCNSSPLEPVFCACIQSQTTYDYIVDEITGSMCDKLSKKKVKANNAKFELVGPPSEGGCGGIPYPGNAKTFQLSMYIYIDEKLKPLGIVFCIVGTLLLFTALLAFGMVMGNKMKGQDQAAEEEGLVEMPEQGNAKEAAGSPRRPYEQPYDDDADTGYYDDDDDDANPFQEADQDGEEQLAMT